MSRGLTEMACLFTYFVPASLEARIRSPRHDQEPTGSLAVDPLDTQQGSGVLQAREHRVQTV